MSGNKIPIKNVMDILLNTILFTMHRVEWSLAIHQDSWEHMIYSLECMDPTVFKWEKGLLVALKDQLTKCHKGDLKQFGYESIIVSFFLERVPLLRPQVAITELDERDQCIGSS